MRLLLEAANLAPPSFGPSVAAAQSAHYRPATERLALLARHFRNNPRRSTEQRRLAPCPMAAPRQRSQPSMAVPNDRPKGEAVGSRARRRPWP